MLPRVGVHDHRYVPDRWKCGQIAASITDILFNDMEYRLTFDKVMWILDRVSRSNQAPIPPITGDTFPSQIDWGTGIKALYNMQHRLQQLDTNGTFLQLQNKQAITCGIMLTDNNGVTYRGKKLLILWSDRGPTDFWTSPFVMYCADICVQNNMNLNLNTTAVGHGKWLHDQIGAVIKRIIIYVFKHGYIDMTGSDSIASKTVNYMNHHHSSSANNTIHRYFILLTPQQIRVANSQVPTIKGIQSWRNIHINIKKEIKVRQFSCNCACCLVTDYTLCTKDMYCNEWHSIKYDKEYPSYEVMRLRDDSDEVMVDLNHNH